MTLFFFPPRLPGRRRARTRGVALPVVLILLTGLILLGTVVAISNVGSERTSANARDQDVAQQAAEAALRAGEQYASANLSGPATGSSSCANGLCWLGSNNYQMTGTYAGKTVNQAIWPTSGASILDNGGPAVVLPATASPNSAYAPRYIIEIQAFTMPGEDVSTANWAYRVSAKGYGHDPATQVVLQSVYVKTGAD